MANSITYLKIGALEHELNNHILLIDPVYQDNDWIVVKEYFEERIKFLKKRIDDDKE